MWRPSQSCVAKGPKRYKTSNQHNIDGDARSPTSTNGAAADRAYLCPYRRPCEMTLESAGLAKSAISRRQRRSCSGRRRGPARTTANRNPDLNS